MLRDCGLPQVSSRSPRPDNPIRVSDRAPSASPNRRSSAKPRVTSGGVRARTQRPAFDDTGSNGEHVLHGAAELRADGVGRAVEPQLAIAQRIDELRAELLRRCTPASARRAVRAPRRLQSSGPRARRAAPAAAPRDTTSPSSLPLACSNPFAQSTSGLPSASCWPRASPTSRTCCAGATISTTSRAAMSASCAVARKRRSSVAPGRNSVLAWRPLMSSTTSGSRAQIASRAPPGTWSGRAPCPTPRHRRCPRS